VPPQPAAPAARAGGSTRRRVNSVVPGLPRHTVTDPARVASATAARSPTIELPVRRSIPAARADCASRSSSADPTPRRCQPSVTTTATCARPGSCASRMYRAIPTPVPDTASSATSASWSAWSTLVRYWSCRPLRWSRAPRKRLYRESALSFPNAARSAGASPGSIGRMAISPPPARGTRSPEEPGAARRCDRSREFLCAGRPPTIGRS
jgi:hypothetical protein